MTNQKVSVVFDRKKVAEKMKESIDKEKFSTNTHKHKICTWKAVKRFGKIKTFADLTPKHILKFDEWLHDGSKTDVSVHTYHKHLRKVTHYLRMANMIPAAPYERVKLSRSKSKERQPFTEDELNSKSLTFHVARHSFETLAISHGVPIEDVARMLGHEDIRIPQPQGKPPRCFSEFLHRQFLHF